jgi:hypothetical protein
MIKLDDAPGLLAKGRFRPWSFEGYGPPVGAPKRVEILTPPATVAVLAAGYRPSLHPTVDLVQLPSP